MEQENIFAKQQISYIDLLADPSKEGIHKVQAYIEMRYQDISELIEQTDSTDPEYLKLMQAKKLFEHGNALFNETIQFLEMIG